MNDAIVVGGLGVVGTATRRMLGISKYVDIKEAEDGYIALWKYTDDVKYVFLCLPTPTVNGMCDASLISRYISRLGPNYVYIIRSTVLPGTARRLMEEFETTIVSNPEFLTEAMADQEALHPDLLVLGADSEKAMSDVWCRFYRHVKADRVVFTDTVTAEFIKYAVNTFYATKVLFANALYECAEKLGVEYDVVREALYARKWIGHNHLTVPWKGQRGLNGKCLPKDLEAFATYTGHKFFDFLVRWNEELSCPHTTVSPRR